MVYGENEARASAVLRGAGIANPARLARLMRETVALLGLDLSGLTVLTEAASGPYVVTPVVAALAGAERVLALTLDSRYAAAEAVVAQTRALETLCGLEGSAEIHTRRSVELFARADIVTNLGFVRPIDAEAVAGMKATAVVPLMCEGWEFRPGDVDAGACVRRGVPVLGTDETDARVDVFAYSGWLCLKMLFDAQVEVHKSSVVVVGGDKFGRTAERLLARAGARVRLVPHLRGVAAEELSAADALVVADYTRTDEIVGERGDISAEELARVAAHATVIQFAGRVDVRGMTEAGMAVYPGVELESHRMGRTLADLGPRPVVELHAAGLKVGQALAEARVRLRLGVDEAIEYALANSPAQRIVKAEVNG